MNITPIHKDQLTDVWPLTKPILARAIARYPRLYDLTLLEEELLEGEVQLWIVSTEVDSILAACITSVVEHDTGAKDCEVLLLAGAGVFAWMPLMQDKVETYAIEQGCTMLITRGRKGWERIGKQYGMKFHSVVLCKELGTHHGK